MQKQAVREKEQHSSKRTQQTKNNNRLKQQNHKNIQIIIKGKQRQTV